MIYGSISLDDTLVVDALPCNGHSGYFVLDRDKRFATLFHVATLSTCRVHLELAAGPKHPSGFKFDDWFKQRPFSQEKMLTRIRFWCDSYDTNGLAFEQGPVKRILEYLSGTTQGDLRPKTSAKVVATAEVAPVVAAQRPQDAAPRPKGKGVIATIADALTREWISVVDIHARLVAAFPDRDPTSLTNTIKTQLGGKLKKERGLNVEFDRKAGKARVA